MEKNYVSPNYALDVYYQLPCIDQCMTGEEWKLFTVLFNQIMIVTQHDKIKVEPIEIKHEWIANKIGKNKKTSERNVERLRQLGVIKVTKVCRNSNKYELNWNVINAIAQSQIENMDKNVPSTDNMGDKNVSIDVIGDKNVSSTDKDKNVPNANLDKNVSNSRDKNVSNSRDKNVSQIINNINKEKENKENPENPVIENPETNSFSDSEVNEIIDSPINLQKEKENTENPVNGNQKSNFISDFSNSVDSPNIVDETDEDTDNPKCDSPKSDSDSKSKPYRVNLNYIDDLERQFNGYTDATSPNAAENSPNAAENSPNAAENSPKATANPKTTATQTPKAGGKYLSANPNLTSNYIKSLSCIFTENNPTILLDLVEASKRTALVMDALDKSIEWMQRHKHCKNKDMEYIAKVYINASQITTPSMQRILEILRTEIIKNGGREMIQSA